MWRFQTEGIVRSSPVMWENLVFVGSDDGSVYGVDRITGRSVWSYHTGDAIAAGPTVADGTLFVGSTDRRLYAFSLSAQ